MEQEPSGQRGAIRAALLAEGNRALTQGAFYLALLGLCAGILVGILDLTGVAKNLELPTGFSFFAGLFCLGLYFLARAGRVKGWVALLAFATLVSLPTLFFASTHFLMPAGAATYLMGPILMIYFFVIFGTGFLFDPMLSLVTSLVAAVGYLLVFLLAQPTLARITTGDPTLQQDLSSLSIAIVRCFMLLFAGLVTGGLAMLVQRFIVHLLEEREKRERISRLFGQYVSPEVREKIVNEKSEVVGERKEVVVLFSDLRGFSTFSEKAQPEEIVLRLNEYFDAMVECITSQGGVVDKFIGDAIMAQFGGLLPLANPCAAALSAALGMRRRLAQLNERWIASGLIPFENGVGMDFGAVLQGNIGSTKRKEFTVIGDTVNTASRVEGLTKDYPQHILITEEVHRGLPPEDQVQCLPLGLVKVKGKEEEVRIFGVGDPAPAANAGAT